MKFRWLLIGAGVLFFIPKTRNMILKAIASFTDTERSGEKQEQKPE